MSRKRIIRRRRALFGCVLVSSTLMIWLFVRYPVKTCIVTGLMLLAALAVAYLPRPITRDDSSGDLSDDPRAQG